MTDVLIGNLTTSLHNLTIETIRLGGTILLSSYIPKFCINNELPVIRK